MVVQQDMPLLGTDSDIDEPTTESTPADTSQSSEPQRIETISRIRRRPADRNALESGQCMLISIAYMYV